MLGMGRIWPVTSGVPLPNPTPLLVLLPFPRQAAIEICELIPSDLPFPWSPVPCELRYACLRLLLRDSGEDSDENVKATDNQPMEAVASCCGLLGEGTGWGEWSRTGPRARLTLRVFEGCEGCQDRGMSEGGPRV